MIMDKQLKNKAIKFRWQDYVQVKDRINFLSENHEWEYSIETEYQFIEPKTWVVKAKLTIWNCVYNWLAQEIEWTSFINKTSALENAETSAVGRACAMAWIWVIDSIASVDEINKATNRKWEFTDNEYKKLEEVKDNYKNWQEAIDSISKKYEISEPMKTKILSLYK